MNGQDAEGVGGQAAKNTRTLFEEAQHEFDDEGDNSALHAIIFDEIDAVARKLLCCLYGVETDQPQ